MHGRGHVAGPAGPAEHGLLDECPVALRRHPVAEELGVLDVARHDDVDRHAVAAELAGQVERPRVQRRLRRAVRAAAALHEFDAITAAWRRELPGADGTSIEPSSRLRRVARLLELRRADLLRRHGTDESTVDLLATLRRSGTPYALTPGQLQRQSLLTSGAITQRLDRAEAAGWVARSGDPSDGRRVVVTLTGAGHREVSRAVRALLAEEDALWDALLAQLSTSDRRALDRSLRRLLAALQPG